MKKLLLVLILLSYPAISAEKQNLPVQQSIGVGSAYKLTHVKRNSFRADMNTDSDEAKYLIHLFYYTDYVVVERVSKQMELRETKKIANLENYEFIYNKLKELQVPDSHQLKRVHELITETVGMQKNYLEYLSANGKEFNASDQLVQQSHGKLMEAYMILLGKYKQQDYQASFYSHLCALDFI